MAMARITKAKQLTERDQAILTDLARCRVLSLEQIKAEYWPRARERTAKERLLRLEKAGYLEHVTVPGERPGLDVQVYHLTPKGCRQAGAPTMFALPGKENEIVHQIRANQVYFSLSDQERATWVVGDVLESFGKQAPDAKYISEDGEAIYVEADTGHYKRRQVAEKLKAWKNIRQVWVCPSGRQGFLRRCGVREVKTYILPRKEAA